MPDPTVIAIDWSGAKKQNLKCGIWVTAIRDGRVVHSHAAAKREEAAAYVQECAPPVVAGFDFSFGIPEWFARRNSCLTIAEVWNVATRDGETWLEPTAPFWRDKGGAPPRDQRFRECEETLLARKYQPKSIFQVVGSGMVGPGSVRGMPHLATLRDSGFAVWPFDTATDRTVIEIYPSLLRRFAPHHDIESFDDVNQRDAEVSARVMWEHRESFATLEAATDPVTLVEGDVWTPPGF